MLNILKNKDGSIYEIEERITIGGFEASKNHIDVGTLVTVVNRLIERIEKLEEGGKKSLELPKPNQGEGVTKGG